jgi:hypothetical protein
MVVRKNNKKRGEREDGAKPPKVPPTQEKNEGRETGRNEIRR